MLSRDTLHLDWEVNLSIVDLRNLINAKQSNRILIAFKKSFVNKLE